MRIIYFVGKDFSIFESLESLSKKLRAFNWNCIEIKDGHSFKSLSKAFNKVGNNTKPTALIIHTTKGKGIKKFENDPVWHARKLVGKDIEIGKKALGIKS